MKAPAAITIDFETKAIRRRPEYPPKPVSVSIWHPGKRRPDWYAWGHPTKNNCEYSTAARAIKDAWHQAKRKTGLPLLFQNGKFDTDVAEVHLEVERLPWDMVHDTMFLIFLDNPYASPSLKPAAQRLLNMPPEERDVVEDWLKKNFKGTRQRLPNGKLESWGVYISEAPGDIVGDYANGDTTRTIKLFNKLFPDIHKRGMLEAYSRYRELMPIMLENEIHGIETDKKLLDSDLTMYEAALVTAEQKLRKMLKTPDLNLNSNDEVADAFSRCGWVDDDQWKVTDSGARSVSKKNLTPDMVNNKKGSQLYSYHTRLMTCVQVQRVWHRQAQATKGTIHTNWQQVKNEGGGAGTGRLQSSPNFQNISKDLETKGDGYIHPAWAGVPQLPMMRKYLMPDKGCVWGHRDYSQQELRILAHFEDGELRESYLRDPKLDIHGIVDRTIQEILNLFFPRTKVKGLVFQKIYGGGIPAICNVLGCDVATAKKVIAAMMVALPGYKLLEADIKATVKETPTHPSEPIYTWGGREYKVRSAGWSKKFKRHMTYEYLLLNYLIQGSAADCTMQALINYHNHPKREARFLVTVHDEINASFPKKRAAEEMKILEEAMSDVEFSLPMLSEGKLGPRWSELKKVA